MGLDAEYEQGMTWETFGKNVADDFGQGEIEFGSGVYRDGGSNRVILASIRLNWLLLHRYAQQRRC